RLERVHLDARVERVHLGTLGDLLRKVVEPYPPAEQRRHDARLRFRGAHGLASLFVISAAARSPTMMQVRFGLFVTCAGKTLASATSSPSTPWTRSSSSTTDPIAHVPIGWNAVPRRSARIVARSTPSSAFTAPRPASAGAPASSRNVSTAPANSPRAMTSA